MPRAEIDLPGTAPYSDAVYARAAANLRQRRGPTHPSSSRTNPAFTSTGSRWAPHVQTGVAGCFSVDEHDGTGIKRHERTRQDKEDDRTRHLVTLRAQTGPVFLAHRPSADVDAALARITAGEPLYDFVAGDGVRHTMWRADAPQQAALVQAFAAIPALHRRRAPPRGQRLARAGTSARRAGLGEWDTMLAVAFSETQAQILAYNRVVKDLHGHTPASFLEVVKTMCAVTQGPAVPARRGEVSMFVGGQWYTLALPPADGGRPAAERLDVSRLHEVVLAPVLGIGDERKDTRIDFIGGGRGTGGARSARGVGPGRRGVLDVSRQRGRADGHFRRRRHHAAEVHVVRTQTARRPAVAPALRTSHACHDRSHLQLLRRPGRPAAARAGTSPA